MARNMYQCTVCGRIFEAYDDANACEEEHNKAEEIIVQKYNQSDRKGEYPFALIVRMTDGTRIEYTNQATSKRNKWKEAIL